MPIMQKGTRRSVQQRGGTGRTSKIGSPPVSSPVKRQKKESPDGVSKSVEDDLILNGTKPVLLSESVTTGDDEESRDGAEVQLGKKRSSRQSDAAAIKTVREEDFMSAKPNESEEAADLREDDMMGEEEGVLPGKGYNPPMKFSFYLTEDEWNEIDPENSGTTLRKDQSRVLGPEWTNIFTRYLAKRNTRCVLISVAGRCRRPDSRKRSAPYFTGSFLCKVPGCSVQYSVFIRAVPLTDDPNPVVVDVEGSGMYDHSQIEEAGLPLPRRPVRSKGKGHRKQRLSAQERNELLRMKEEARMRRHEEIRRNKFERASVYGSGSLKKVVKLNGNMAYRRFRPKPHASFLSGDQQMGLDNSGLDDSNLGYGEDIPSPPSERVMYTLKKRQSHPLSSVPLAVSPPVIRSNNPALEAGELELQALQIKYYKMKMYKTELEIRQLDPHFDHRMFDGSPHYMAVGDVDESGAEYADTDPSVDYAEPNIQDEAPGRYVTII